MAAFLGKLIKKGIKLRESLEQKYGVPLDLQKNELLKLLIAAQNTSFGRFYDFDQILEDIKNPDHRKFLQTFRENIPVHDYDSIFEQWWMRTREGEPDVCWPGKVKYYALSSGTSGDSSKFIPVSKTMLKSITRTSVRQLLALARFDLPPEVFRKGALMLGGSTKLRKKGFYYEADLSGITASNIPFWFQHFYKPGKEISRYENWGEKLDKITEKAPEWDIGFIVGVPSWIQILLEKIIDHYHLKHIHEIWPGLSVFVHGGVSFEPYHNSFKKLLGRDIHFVETYLASEGFIAYQCRPGTSSMKMVLNNGIFYEFIPFDDDHFDAAGEPKPGIETLLIDEAQEGKEYALLISTCAGAWRYLIGDVIKFTSTDESEIVITGRTKQFLSLCGEHMSIDNMNKAIKMVEEEMGCEIKEFTVTGLQEETTFAHKWYIGCNDGIDSDTLKQKLDEKLKVLNDDYRTERGYALKNVYVQKLPVALFYEWMRINGKEGGQNKFPRVLKGQKLEDWERFLNNKTNGSLI